MKKILLLPVLAILSMAFYAFIPYKHSILSSKADDKKVMEIALYKVKKEHLADFKTLNNNMSEQLSTYSGYMSSKTYQGISADSVFVDIVWWESIDKAKEAEAKFLNDDKLKDYRESLGRVLYYDHVTPIESGKLSFNAYNEKNATIELGIFKVKEGMNSQYLDTRVPLMNVISKKYGEGLKEGIAYQSVERPLLHVEFTYWSSMDVCTKAQHEINEKEPTFNPFIQNFDNKGPSFYGFFKLIR
ncbi:MAG: antibiotic biosynthesis monooxygenase family protein [Flavisolibacter sp.]